MPTTTGWARALALTLLLGLIPPAAAQNGFLWEVSGQRNTVYLLGSIHALKADADPFGPAIESAFREAEVVVLEVSTTTTGRSEAIREMLTEDGGPTLQQALSREQLRRARDLGQELGIDLEQLDRMAPWVLALVVTRKAMLEAGFHPSQGVDARIEERAREAGKRVLTLETIREQLAIFQGLSPQAQGEYLLQALEEADRIGAKLGRLAEAWQEGDAQAVQRSVTEELQEIPELRERMLTQRNQRWLPRIRKYLSHDRDYLVVVGAAHLLGEQGLVQQLRESGHLVSRP